MKRKILSMALCLSMLISLVAFAPASFAVDSSEPFTMSEQNNQASTQTDAGNVPAPEQTTPAPDAGNTDSSVAPDANAPAETQPDANGAPADGTVPNAAPGVQDPAQTPDAGAQEPAPPAVNFTDAGPFLPAVNVAVSAVVKDAAMQARMAANRVLMAAPKAALAAVTPEPENGLILNKTATKNTDGTYKITLDAYTTGTVTSSSKMVPVDIVLVLDQSGSMNFDMSGNETRYDEKRRQTAMKTAVKNFIDGVNEKYSQEADHRISLVEFRGYYEKPPKVKILSDWSKSDVGSNSTHLKNVVSGLKAEGATRTDLGMEKAVELMTPQVQGGKYYYDGANKERQKVVIVFTDGSPNDHDGFDINVANNAIKHANTLKNSLGCTVYSIGIFNGADPSQSYGGKGPDDSWPVKDTTESLLSNRFMNYMSSNYKSAESMHFEIKDVSYVVKVPNKYYGQEKPWWWKDSIMGKFDNTTEFFEETRYEKRYVPVNPPAQTGNNYYLSANNAESLNSIFQNIVQNIVTPQIDLGSQTVIRDIISESFELPSGADASSINLYTAKAKADGTFENRVPTTEATATLSSNGKTVDVTGFDYNKNFVTKNEKPEEKDAPYGKKLIIEFNVKVRDGFLGGNGVPTNGTASGVYGSDGKLVEGFPVPTVDVKLADFTLNPKDKNVYLFGDLKETDFNADKQIKFTDPVYDGKTFGQLEDWQKRYVDLDVDPVGEKTKLTEDTNYTVSAKLSPTNQGSVQPVNKSATAKINVYKPELTYKDVTRYYGAVADNDAIVKEASAGEIVWKHAGVVADPAKMTGTAPAVTSTAAIADPSHVKNGVFNTAEDSYYNVTSKIGADDINQYVTYMHSDCNPKCKFDSTKGQFIVHKKTCTLDITKNVVNGTGNDSFVMKVTGNPTADFSDFEILIKDGQTIKVKGLPVGTYTVTEDADWAWKYTVSGDNGKPVTLQAGSDAGHVTITNTPKNDKWLNFVTSVQNLFNGKAH